MTEQLPVFETARLRVRPRSMDDLDACLEMDRDPEVARFVVGTLDRSRRSPGLRRESYPPYVSDRHGYWSIMAPEFVGWILLTPLDLVGPEVEIGWRVTARARGHGYAPEAARCVFGYALNELRLPQVVADINPANSASLAVAGKLGLRPAGTVGYAGGIVIRYIATSVS